MNNKEKVQLLLEYLRHLINLHDANDMHVSIIRTMKEIEKELIEEV